MCGHDVYSRIGVKSEMRAQQLQAFQRSKRQTMKLSPFLQDDLTRLLPLQKIKSISCFDLIYIISEGFPTSSVFHISVQLSLSPAASSINACPVLLSGLETGTGRSLGTGGSKVVSEERQRVTVCQGFVCTMRQDNRRRGR